MRERLRIGEVAKLLGVTPRTVRHYEEIGLLERPERSEVGYRLYGADELLRLHRVKELRSLGLPLDRIKGVLGEPGSGNGLRGVLEALLDEVEGQIGALQERRDRLRETLAREDLEAPAEEPRTMKMAEEYLGGYMKDVSPSLLEQERKVWATLDAFEWPEGYDEGNERLFRYHAEHPEEYRKWISLGESLASLADLPQDDPAAEDRARRLAEDFFRHFQEHLPPEEAFTQPPWAEGPLGLTMSGMVIANLSPTQQRVFELLGELATEAHERGGETLRHNAPERGGDGDA